MNTTPSPPLEIDVQSVKRQLDAGQALIVLDCRRADEYQFNHLGCATWIPMEEIAGRLGELPPNAGQPLVVYCHHGGRSLRVASWLRQHGWGQAQSMTGGIDAWAQEIDSSCPRYS